MDVKALVPKQPTGMTEMLPVTNFHMQQLLTHCQF